MSLNKNMRVMIVDDYNTMLRILRNLLRQLDFNNVEQLEQAFAAYGDELACVIIEPIAGNMNFVR